MVPQNQVNINSGSVVTNSGAMLNSDGQKRSTIPSPKSKESLDNDGTLNLSHPSHPQPSNSTVLYQQLKNNNTNRQQQLQQHQAITLEDQKETIFLESTKHQQFGAGQESQFQQFHNPNSTSSNEQRQQFSSTMRRLSGQEVHTEEDRHSGTNGTYSVMERDMISGQVASSRDVLHPLNHPMNQTFDQLNPQMEVSVQQDSTETSKLETFQGAQTSIDDTSVDTKREDYYNISKFIDKRSYDFERNRQKFKRDVRGWGDEDKLEKKSRKVIKETNILQRKREAGHLDPASQFAGSEAASIRQQLQFTPQVPRHLIKFANKSEEERFMRLALRVYSLHTQSKDEVLYTYQRTFKFLSEVLKPEEFQTLNFTNVNSLIDQVFQTKKTPDPEQVYNQDNRLTLRQFIFRALLLPYKVTDNSLNLLQHASVIKSCIARKVWQKDTQIDLHQKYTKKDNCVTGFDHLGGELAQIGTSDRSQSLKSYIKDKKKTDQPEQELPMILAKQYYHVKEQSHRPMLHKLSKKVKAEAGVDLQDVDHSQMAQDSSIRRNKLVLEEILRKRNDNEWLMEMDTQIHAAAKHQQKISREIKRRMEMDLPPSERSTDHMVIQFCRPENRPNSIAEDKRP